MLSLKEGLEESESRFKFPELDTLLRGRLTVTSGFDWFDGEGQMIERDWDLRRFDFLCFAKAVLSNSIILTVFARSIACFPN